MTPKKPASGRPDAGFLKADSVEDAIVKLQALKKERATAPAAADALAPRRGRPPKAAADSQPAGVGLGVGRPTAHRPLGLLEVQDKTDLDALLADPRLSSHIAQRLDDRFALVLPASLAPLQAALLKVGHTPKLLNHSPETEQP